MKDPLRHLPGYVLRRASTASLHALNDALVPLGVTFTEASVMMVICANPGATLTAIGRVLDIQRANMTPLVARLEARGLIDRASVDGRAHGLTLSVQGSALHARILDAVNTHENALLARVPEAHRAALLPILQALWTR